MFEDMSNESVLSEKKILLEVDTLVINWPPADPN